MKKSFRAALVALTVWAGACLPVQAAAAETEIRTVNLDPAVLRPIGGAWSLGDNRVYFGQYGGVPTAYRVLTPAETQTVSEEDGLLLDCDTVLRRKAFDGDFRKNEGQMKLPSEWKGSDLEHWLNGGSFYDSRGVFTRTERDAIVETTLESVTAPYSSSHWTDMYTDYGSTDHVFLLSAAEVELLYAGDAAAKNGSTTDWWIRSAFDKGGNGMGSVHFDGHVCNNSVSNFVVGVSPAFNVRLSSILLVTPAEGDKTHPLEVVGSPGEAAEWKLTLLDPGKTVNVPEGRAASREGELVTVPYTWEGNSVTQISLVITDAENARVLFYGCLAEAADKTGTAEFNLPPQLKKLSWGRDYHVYLTAEDVNGPCRTDYASPLYEIRLPA